MQFVKGMVVRSKKGHDKGRFYVVCSADNNSAALTDAQSKTADKPKIKNLIHLAPTKTVLSEEQLGSDDEIRRILADFNGRVRLSKGG